MTRALVLCAALLLGGCRDGAELFVPEAPVGDSLRLTFNLGDDRTPLWGTTDDTVYYAGVSFPPYGSTDNMLFGVAREDGRARPILPFLQAGVRVQPSLTAPAIAPDGKRVAVIEVLNVIVEEDCDSVSPLVGGRIVDNAPLGPASEVHSVLKQVALRVRGLDSNGADQALHTINFEGRTSDGSQHPFGVPELIINHAYPFHHMYEEYRLPFFRPSWSPDGTRLVFSDGLRLRIWRVGQTTTDTIPGTQDGVLPAWSPDGRTIAFTKLLRGAPINYTFLCWVDQPQGRLIMRAYQRTDYGVGNRRTGELVVVSPDGVTRRVLGLGEAPAWTPDGSSIVVHRNASLVSVNAESGAATEIPNTQNSYEPAVSRDGRWLAFAKSVTRFNHDIWLAPF